MGSALANHFWQSTVFAAAALAFGLTQPRQLNAQSKNSSKESFEVAAVKPNNSGTGDSSWSDHRKAGRVITVNISLRDYIERAYGVRAYQITGPGWIKSERYDLLAEAPGMLTEGRLQQMLQTMLADRFGLVLHREEKTLPAYELVVANSGPKMQAVEGHGRSGTNSHRGYISGQRASMAELSESLSRRMDRPVVDRTRLEGGYNFTLQWASEEMDSMPSAQADAALAEENTGPSIFTAIQEQLGLKLVPRKDPVEILVIDHVDKVPTEN